MTVSKTGFYLHALHLVATLLRQLINNFFRTIMLNDASTSSHHARISHDNGTWWLEDLGSATGTLLNELPLSRPASLTDGDVIGIGVFRFKLEVTS